MTLFDAYGREVKTEFLKGEQAAPTMAGVRNIYSVTHPSVALSPDKLFAILTQAEFGDPFEYLELAEDMEEKDLHYVGVLGTRKETCAQLDLVVKPASQSAGDVRAADMVRAQLKSPALLLTDALFDVLDAIGKGFSVVEILWDTAGPEWFPQAMKWRDPRWFMFDWISGQEVLVRTLRDEQGLDKLYPSATDADDEAFHFKKSPWGSVMTGRQPLTAPLAPFKFITHQARTKSGLPIRGGLARASAWSWLFKNCILKDWLGFCETYGQPFRVGKYQTGASEHDKEKLLEAVRRIGPDAAAIMPESMMIEFVQAREAKGEVFREMSAYLDAQVSIAVLGQTLTTDLPHGGGGSRAAAQVHQLVRRDILASDARRVAGTLLRDLVKPIVDLNLGPQAVYPSIELGLPDDVDEKVFAEICAMLADRGLEIDQRMVRDRLGMSEPSAGGKVLHALAGKGEPVP
jgi:phage gp29-like protein